MSVAWSSSLYAEAIAYGGRAAPYPPVPLYFFGKCVEGGGQRKIFTQIVCRKIIFDQKLLYCILVAKQGRWVYEGSGMKGYPKVITMKLRIRSDQIGSEKLVNEYSITKTGLSTYLTGSRNACE
jgi:hypothetical protein